MAAIPRWEYKTLDVTEDSERDLDELGQQGWELVVARPLPSYTVTSEHGRAYDCQVQPARLYFKRPVSTE